MERNRYAWQRSVTWRAQFLASDACEGEICNRRLLCGPVRGFTENVAREFRWGRDSASAEQNWNVVEAAAICGDRARQPMGPGRREAYRTSLGQGGRRASGNQVRSGERRWREV